MHNGRTSNSTLGDFLAIKNYKLPSMTSHQAFKIGQQASFQSSRGLTRITDIHLIYLTVDLGSMDTNQHSKMSGTTTQQHTTISKDLTLNSLYVIPSFVTSPPLLPKWKTSLLVKWSRL